MPGFPTICRRVLPGGREIDPLKVYIGYDSREEIAWQVCQHSIARLSSREISNSGSMPASRRRLVGILAAPFLTPYLAATSAGASSSTASSSSAPRERGAGRPERAVWALPACFPAGRPWIRASAPGWTPLRSRRRPWGWHAVVRRAARRSVGMNASLGSGLPKLVARYAKGINALTPVPRMTPNRLAGDGDVGIFGQGTGSAFYFLLQIRGKI